MNARDDRPPVGPSPAFRRRPRRRRYAHAARVQFGELFVPRGAPPSPEGWPVAVVLHGGYWKARYGRWLQWPVCHDLMKRGWAAWNLEYRRLGRGGGWPMTFQDVAMGVDLLPVLRDRGAPIDLDRVVALGHSAGGHLALWAASRGGLPPMAPGGIPRVTFRAVVSQAGVADLARAAHAPQSADVVRELLGGDVEGNLKWASPIENLPFGMPSLAVHGSLDETVSRGQSERFVQAAVAAGDPSTLEWIEGEDHMAHLKRGSRSWAAAVDWLEQFK